jgi:diguanylate cyclase (GGDEF)-like protein/PAS domain S-box-containing protein
MTTADLSAPPVENRGAGVAWDWGRILLGLVFGGLLMAVVLPRLLPRGAWNLLVFDCGILLNGAAVVALLYRVSTHPQIDPRTRRAWRWVAVGFGSYVVGDVLYSFYEFAGRHPYPSPADAFYLGAYPLILFGLLARPTRKWEMHERVGLLLDMAALLIGGTMVVWLTVLTPAQQPRGPLEVALACLYPLFALSVLMGFTAAVPGQCLSRSDVAMALGLLFQFAGDFAYSPELVNGVGPPLGAWLGSLTIVAGWAFVGASGYLRYREGGGSATIPARPALSFNVVVQTIVVLGYGVLLVALAVEAWPPTLAGLIGGGVALTAVVLVRLARAVGDNVRHATERESEARFRSLVQNASDIILVVDAELRIVYGTPSAERALGWSAETPAGGHLLDFLHPDSIRSARAFLGDLLGGVRTEESFEWKLKGTTGPGPTLEVRGVNLMDDPTVGGLVLTGRSVDERKRLEAELTRQALYDPLTGLANRILLADRLDQALLTSRREDSSVAVLLVDLDDFRHLNDSLGHGSGDRILVRAARRIESALPEVTTVARLGGDEFAVVLEETEVHGAAEAAERIHRALGDPFDEGGQDVRLEATIGIAVSADSVSAAELLRNADLAMHEAKRAQRGGHRAFEPVMHLASVSRLEAVTALHRAREREEFRLVYQPIVELPTGRVVGVEALLRWDDPAKGLVTPAEFIPLAEETGFVAAIGDWVIAEACRTARGWGGPSGAPQLALNVSTRQVQDPGFLGRLDHALEKAGLPPERLALEITESRLMSSPELGVRLLRELKSLGIGLAIDDFGTGYSSLSYLRSLPVDTLKIDQSFAHGLDRDARSLRLIQGILDLARALGLSVVAEGIETVEQAEALLQLGCPLAQGFFFSHPLNAEALQAFLAAPLAAGLRKGG